MALEMTNPHNSTDEEGNKIPPNSGIFPILLEIEKGLLKVIGTGFYITRYGLFLTASHIMLDVFDKRNIERGAMFVLHATDDGPLHLRAIKRFHYDNKIDIALGEADNFGDHLPDDPLMNRTGRLLIAYPTLYADLATYAYPRNEPLDFRKGTAPELSSNFFAGQLTRFCDVGDHPFMPYRHFETSIQIGSGASGGPVFCNGFICGIAARAWDFDGGEFEGDNLSYVIPIEHCLHLGLDNLAIPRNSWEEEQVPPDRRGGFLSLRDLMQFGHVKSAIRVASGTL